MPRRVLLFSSLLFPKGREELPVQPRESRAFFLFYPRSKPFSSQLSLGAPRAASHGEGLSLY